MPLLRVLHRLVHTALREARAQRRYGDPALVQDAQELRVAAPRLPSRLAAGTRTSWKDSSLVSDAFQPTFEYGAATVNPGVPDGTMIAEISGLPSGPGR
ncbi:hypothetical protein SHKM778_81330 [Streptomyces sp. KM77-8]|uniref:Uncharacterized protein n=1 Tax=Streptomyces haneummycinicus TaxID=3074435 RepID=A0AAT9HXA4_9ACTN